MTKSLDLTGLRPRGLAWALAFLVLFDVAVARSDLFWAVPERSRSGTFHVVIDRIMAARPDPVVAFLGSSRVRDAVLPGVVEEELGLPRGSVANLALTAGTPVDAREIVRRRPDWFRRGTVVAVGVEDWYFLRERPLHERELRFCSTAELLAPGSGATRGDVAEHLVPAFPAARRIGGILHGGPRSFRALRLDAGDRLDWRTADVDRGPETVDVAHDVERYYGTGEPASLRVAALSETVGLLRERGAGVVLVQVPWRDEYVDLVERLHPSEREDVRRRLAALAAELDVPLIAAERGPAIGIDNRLFRDFGHLTDAGAEVFSRWLVARLREAGRLPADRPR